MNWEWVRNFLIHAQRENGDCTVTVLFTSGHKMSAQLNFNTPAPHTWQTNAIMLTTIAHRGGVTTHLINTIEIAAISVASAS